jgi:hypothetical protein
MKKELSNEKEMKKELSNEKEMKKELSNEKEMKKELSNKKEMFIARKWQTLYSRLVDRLPKYRNSL